MISKSLAEKILNVALATGGDYAEIYLEQNNAETIDLDNGIVESFSRPESYGAGIRILQGFRSVYGYTSDLKAASLLALADTLSKAFEGKRIIEVTSVKKQHIKNICPIEDHVINVDEKEKIAFLKTGFQAMKEVDQRLVRIQNGLSTNLKQIEIYNADSEVAKHYVTVEERCRVFNIAVAFDGTSMETGFSAPGRCAGWDYFKKQFDYVACCKEAAQKAVMMLTAKQCPSGVFPVVIAKGWGGVVFHEACGHSLEAAATAKHLSVFSDSIGKQIASPIVSAFDDGTMPNEWGSNSIDNEGHKTQKNQLIKNGICVGFMVDRLNGRRLKMEANGTSRRQDYTFEPVSRMSNTYIAAGKDDPAQIVKDTPLGIYVADFGGGSVQPTTGEFNFSASEAYIIRDGKICEPVKGCTLIGSGKEVLMNIDRVGNDVALGQGNCGASSGMVPVNVGQPTIRISKITVGGQGGKLE